VSYPFDDLRDFEKFRGIALQDPTAARLQLQLRQSKTARTIVRIYYGPPGTGKTLTAVREAVRLADPGFGDLNDFAKCFARFAQLTSQVAFVTFHQSLQYEDVVESIRPALSQDEGLETVADADEPEAAAPAGAGNDPAATTALHYAFHEGPLMRLRRQAAENPSDEYVLVIDEINRGDPSRILGPLLSAIEPDKRAGSEFPIGFEAQYPRSEEDTRFFLPANLHIIGTMNSADRNIALVDYALRRRFEFVELPPNESVLPATVEGTPGLEPRALLAALNQRIRFLLDADHRIGHGYFARVKTNMDVIEVMARKVLPLLAEYFYGTEHLLLLTLGDTVGGPYNVHKIERSDEQFDDVFSLPLETAVEIGYRAPANDLAVRVDSRFWNPHSLVPGPDDEDYAVRAIRKIYEPGEPAQPAAGIPTPQPEPTQE
jgi:5-methylcytosine-specific restriction protein B